MFVLLDKIPIQMRFFGVGMLFVMIMAWQIVFDLVGGLMHEKAMLASRLNGLEYIRIMNEQLVHFQKIRGLGYLYLEGDTSVADEMERERRAVEDNFALLEGLVEPRDVHTCAEKLDDLRHRYEKAKAEFDAICGSPTDETERMAVFDRYSDLIDRLLYFNSYVAVTYNIGENTDWHLFVLSELLAERIPASLEILGRLRGISSGAVQRGSIGPYEREQIQFYIKLLKHNRGIIHAKLTHIFEHDSGLATRLVSEFNATMTANRQFVGSIERLLNDPEKVKRAEGRKAFAMATENMQKALELIDTIHQCTGAEIREHAQRRIDALSHQIYSETLILLVGLVVFWYFYDSSMGYIRKIKNAEKAKDDFLSHMSHEIRTPLNAILGFIGILKDRTADPQNRMYIETIQKSSTHLLSIINDILDLSKIEHGKLSIQAVPFHPRREFSPIIAIYLAKANEKKITFQSVIDSSLPKCITSDPVRLKQIISNLLSNAIKFTPEEGSVTLSLGYDEESRILSIDVTDTGIGIPASKQKRVFEAFTQADDSTTRHYGGTGLGLAICSRLVSMMEGQITLSSKVDEGSAFSVRIPIPHCVTCIVEYDDDVEHRQRRSNPPPQPKRFSGTVLLVEDNETNRMYMEILLDKAGLAYEIAEDGVEAVEKFKTGRYDIILMDENMPRMNGLEAAAQIAQIEAEESRPHTPIVAVTANALQGDREAFLSAGMDGYLSKPVNQGELNEIFEKLLKKGNLIHYPIQSFSAKP